MTLPQIIHEVQFLEDPNYILTKITGALSILTGILYAVCKKWGKQPPANALILSTVILMGFAIIGTTLEFLTRKWCVEPRWTNLTTILTRPWIATKRGHEVIITSREAKPPSHRILNNVDINPNQDPLSVRLTIDEAQRLDELLRLHHPEILTIGRTHLQKAEQKP